MEGLGASSFSSSGSVSSDGLFPSWRVAAYGTCPVGKVGPFGLGLVAELGFGRWGACYTARSDQGAVIARYGLMLYSIDIPLLLRAEIKAGPGRAFLAAGGFLSFVPWAKSLDQSSSGIGKSDLNLSCGLMPGASGGLGYELPLGRGILSMELRGDYGFETLSAATVAEDQTISAWRISILAGYGFPLSPKAAPSNKAGKRS